MITDAVCIICSAPTTNSEGRDSHLVNLNPEKHSKISQCFLVQASRYLDIDEIPDFHPAQTITATNDKDNTRNNVSCCDGCFTLVETYCNIYQQWNYLQLQLDWITGEIAGVMKDSDTPKIPRNILETSLAKFRSNFQNKVSDKRKCCPQLILKRINPQKDSQHDGFQNLLHVKEEIPHPNSIESTFEEYDYLQTEEFQQDNFQTIEVEVKQEISHPNSIESTFEEDDSLQTKDSQQDNFQTIEVEVKREISHPNSIESTFEEDNSLQTNSSNFNAKAVNVQNENYSPEANSPRKDIFSNARRTARLKKSFNCRGCDKVLPNKQLQLEHERITHGGKPFKCKFCERRFPLKQHHLYHEATHSGQKPHKCQYCGHGYYWKYQKTRHEALHKEGRPIQRGR